MLVNIFEKMNNDNLRVVFTIQKIFVLKLFICCFFYINKTNATNVIFLNVKIFINLFNFAKKLTQECFFLQLKTYEKKLMKIFIVNYKIIFCYLFKTLK